MKTPKEMDYDEYVRFVRTEEGHSMEHDRAIAYVQRLQKSAEDHEQKCNMYTLSLRRAMATMNSGTLQRFIVENNKAVLPILRFALLKSVK